MTWTVWNEQRVRASAAVAAAALLLTFVEARMAFRDEVVVPTPPSRAQPTRRHIASARIGTVALGPLFAVASPHRDAMAPPASPADVAPITVLGTIAGGDMPSVLCQLGSAPPVILHVGDTLGGWRLQHIAPAAVIVVDAAGRRRELRLLPPGN